MTDNKTHVIIIPITKKMHEIINHIFIKLDHIPIEEFYLDFYNITLDYSVKSLTGSIDSNDIINTIMHYLIPQDRINNFTDAELLHFYNIIFDIILEIRNYIVSIDVTDKSLYVTQVNNGFLTVQYFIKDK